MQRSVLVGAAMAAALLFAGCSGGSDEAADDTTTTSTTATPSTEATTTTTVPAHGVVYDDPIPPETEASSGLKPPDRDSPVAGMCGEATGDVVELSFTVDLMPSPRCVKVTANQRLSVRNDNTEPEDVSFAHFTLTLAPGESQLLDQPVGEYLQPGIHSGPLGCEVWLQG